MLDACFRFEVGFKFVVVLNSVAIAVLFVWFRCFGFICVLRVCFLCLLDL